MIGSLGNGSCLPVKDLGALILIVHPRILGSRKMFPEIDVIFFSYFPPG